MQNLNETFLLFLKEIDPDFQVINAFYNSKNSEISFLLYDITNPISTDIFQKTIKEYKEKKQPLIIVYSFQWAEKQAIIKSRILSLFQKNNTIHGRKTKLLRIDKAKAEAFLKENHLQGYVKAKLKLGLYFNDELVAVATFSAGRKMKEKPEGYRSFELIRYANKMGLNVVGGLSKLIYGFARSQNANDIMTYVDTAWSTGESFKKMGFTIKGILPPILISEVINSRKIEYYNEGSLKLIWENTN